MGLYVGITGLPGAGKDTVADQLTDSARVAGVSVYRYNLSDEIRHELARRGGNASRISRAALIEIGNELREAYGGGILASRVIARDAGSRLVVEEDRPVLVIVVGIRSPEEVRTFRNAWGSQFVLIAVRASQEIRSIRLAARGQYREDFRLSDDLDQADQAIGIPACTELADWHILNDSTLQELQATIRAFFDHNMRPLLGVGVNVP